MRENALSALLSRLEEVAKGHGGSWTIFKTPGGYRIMLGEPQLAEEDGEVLARQKTYPTLRDALGMTAARETSWEKAKRPIEPAVTPKQAAEAVSGAAKKKGK